MLPANAGQSDGGRRRNCYPRRSSIAAPLSLLNQKIGSRQNPVTEDFAGTGLEVRPFDGARARRGSRHQIAYDLVALTNFNMNARPEPGFDLAGVTKLSEGYALHG